MKNKENLNNLYKEIYNIFSIFGQNGIYLNGNQPYKKVCRFG
jgi:hypothetical protein